jgi:NADH dehydrogenase
MGNNIVILGAGFAGLRCALKLEKLLKKIHPLRGIILVDKNSYHTYTAQLYEAASAYHVRNELLGSSLCLPIATIMKKRRINFIQQEVYGIDIANRVVRTDGGDEIRFEHLVLAFGSEVMHFGIAGVKEYAYSLKTLRDALAIHQKIESVFKESPREKEIKIMIIGGGATGVELIAEIAVYARHLAKYFGRDYSKTRIFLFEAQSSILPQSAPSQRLQIELRLKKLGVEIFLNTKIKEVLPSCVLFDTGQKCEADVILWGGGVRGPSLVSNVAGLALDPRGRVQVDEYLRANEYVFAIGDNAFYVDKKTGVVASPTAFIAEQEADIAAENIVSSLIGRPLKEYHPSIPGLVLSCGGKYAVAYLFGITISGIFGWFIKKLIDLKYFLSLLPWHSATALWVKELWLFSKND